MLEINALGWNFEPATSARAFNPTYRLALARYRQHKLDEALATLTDALRLDDRLPDVHYLRSLCLREKHRLPDALHAIERAVALDPAMIAAHEELADLLGAMDRRAEQLEQLQLLAGLDRGHAARQVAVAMAHGRAGRWDLAVLTLGSALERNPNDLEIYRALGEVWLDRPRDDPAFVAKARDALERVATNPAATSQALLLYARVLLEEGDTPGAEHALQQATTRYPIDPQALLLYASTAETLNHFEVARDALIRYDAISTSDADPAARASRLASLSQRVESRVPVKQR